MPDRFDEIVESLRDGATVLTVNRRLSQHLHSEYNKAELRAGKRTWETPTILPIGAWLGNFYAERPCIAAEPTLPLLGESRSRVLWMRVVEKGCTAEQRGLLFARGAGETSYDAYKLMGEYNLSSLGDELYMTDEVYAFNGWCKAYRRELFSLGCIDQTILKSYVIELMKRGRRGPATYFVACRF